ncbi:cytochrome d ubiquinol oxidase subunit II [Acetobacter oeni]|uniref:Ubiquinol oxidase subunit II, cyanide insensitive n=1 Tax=Acetobacter oeni TaxID=304077 RepID=A0A511XH43_9PROT|nr:cytochrome d ubiquinol oxidase subunit II [Acetobacter oeni]MBB3882407.1 cytochrome d ubiquinol oxidase subunit II [Acetobacter oeni]NHO18494.1 cytochrome d ubiquinol oxidase subunit II [Acetobacter oeni]GBR09431.1 cytochrome bd ubiquinol oxidase subunit II [Acetobacter oeni LMG 21952]GEN62265.1 ubiquinol oxidase subunit II, cyanide insensitive [Acetobacter oeni]
MDLATTGLTGAAYWLPIVWAVLVATAIFIYVVLDGFDLGLGILFLAERDKRHRNIMIQTIAPVWDGNETWMIFGGAALYGVFPNAYATILPALYLPVLIMLFALILRGVGFEFRSRMHTEKAQNLWDIGFCGGSFVATLMQGIILGTLVSGIHVEDNKFAGSSLDWLAPFPIFCGLAVVCGYSLLGATWLIWRTESDLQSTMRKWAGILSVAMLVMIAGVSVWTPALHTTYMQNWTAWPQILLVAPVPLAVIAITGVMFLALRGKTSRRVPFFCALAWFFVSFTGLGINIWPYIVPPAMTIWQASSPPASQAFLLAGSMFLLPLILAYTAYAYHVFRGTVNEHSESYH